MSGAWTARGQRRTDRNRNRGARRHGTPLRAPGQADPGSESNESAARWVSPAHDDRPAHRPCRAQPAVLPRPDAGCLRRRAGGGQRAVGPEPIPPFPHGRYHGRRHAGPDGIAERRDRRSRRSRTPRLGPGSRPPRAVPRREPRGVRRRPGHLRGGASDAVSGGVGGRAHARLGHAQEGALSPSPRAGCCEIFSVPQPTRPATFLYFPPCPARS